jgi:hypothetical protein
MTTYIAMGPLDLDFKGHPQNYERMGPRSTGAHGRFATKYLRNGASQGATFRGTLNTIWNAPAQLTQDGISRPGIPTNNC